MNTPLLVIACTLVLTNTIAVGAEVELHAGSKALFATPEQAAELLGREDAFTRELSRFDLQARLGTSDDVTTEDLLEFAKKEVRPWSKEEREKITRILASIRERLAKFTLDLPPEILLIKTSGKEEAGAAYCRQNAIILPRQRISSGPKALERLLLHELFHVLSRHSPQTQQKLYQLIGFRPCPKVALPGSLRDRKLTNPDGPSLDWFIQLQTSNQQQLRAVPLLYASAAEFDPDSGKSFFSYLVFRLLVVEEEEDSWKVALKDGEPILLDPRKEPDYHRQIGKNTGYIIHPDEILAENFVHLVLETPSLPNPELVAKIGEQLK